MRRVLPWLLFLGLSACAYTPPQAPQGSGKVPQVGPEPADTAPPVSASTALVQQARTSLAAGDTRQAAAAIERALRIEPNNPYLWIELGTVRLTEGDRQQARALGLKARRLAGNDVTAQEAAQALIDRSGT